MMSPDAGGMDQITQNRGYVTIPEAGDQVMTNFVHSLDINVGQNITTNVGMSKSDTVTIKYIQSVGAMKMTSVMGDSSMLSPESYFFIPI